jgi:hypothetical protein
MTVSSDFVHKLEVQTQEFGKGTILVLEILYRNSPEMGEEKYQETQDR